MGTMSWKEVAANPSFSALSPDEQEAARGQYFREVVAPKVPTEDLDGVRAVFDSDTKIVPPTLLDRAKSTVSSALQPDKSPAEIATTVPGNVVTPDAIQNDLSTTGDRALTLSLAKQLPQTGAPISDAEAVQQSMAKTMDFLAHQDTSPLKSSVAAGKISPEQALSDADEQSTRMNEREAQQESMRIEKAQRDRLAWLKAQATAPNANPKMVAAYAAELAKQEKRNPNYKSFYQDNPPVRDAMDAAGSVAMGTLGLGQMATNLAYAGSNSTSLKNVADSLGEKSQELRDSLSPEMKTAIQKHFVNEDGSTGEAWSDPRSYLFQVYNQAGSALPMIGVGRVIGLGAEGIAGLSRLKPAMDVANVAGEDALQAALANGVEKSVALQTSKNAAQSAFAAEAAKIGVNNASLSGTASKMFAANLAGQTISGTYLHGSDAANAAMEQIAQMSHEKLMLSPEYAAAYQANLNNGESDEQARYDAKESVRRAAGITAAEVTGSAALPAQLLLSFVNTKLFTGGMGFNSRLKNAGAALGLESASNAGELGMVAFGGNVGVQQHADATVPLSRDVADTAVQAGIGAVGMASPHLLVNPHTVNQPDQPAGVLSRAAQVAVRNGITPVSPAVQPTQGENDVLQTAAQTVAQTGTKTDAAQEVTPESQQNDALLAELNRRHTQDASAQPQEVSATTPPPAQVAPPIQEQQQKIDAAAHEAATSPLNDLPEPTQAQKEAGNYRKGHISIHGLDFAIENPQGSTRSGIDPNGKQWEVTLPAHYGYIKRTEGSDGDHVDAYIGSHLESDKVFVVDQVDANTKKFDEHKVMLGYSNLDEAVQAYHQGFSDGRGGERIGAVTPMSVDSFKTWLNEGDTKKPLANLTQTKIEPEKPVGQSQPETPAMTTESSIRPHVEQLIKLRRAAGELHLAPQLDIALNKAKGAMKSGTGNAEDFKRMAKVFAGKDVDIHAALTNIAAALEPAKTETPSKPKAEPLTTEERARRKPILDQAKVLGVKTVARPFSEIEKDVLQSLETQYSTDVSELSEAEYQRMDDIATALMDKIAGSDEKAQAALQATIESLQSKYSGREYYEALTNHLEGMIHEHATQQPEHTGSTASSAGDHSEAGRNAEGSQPAAEQVNPVVNDSLTTHPELSTAQDGNVKQEAAKSKKLEVLKAQAQGKISGDQGAALKELADAGEHAAVDKVLKPEQPVDAGNTSEKPVEKTAGNVQVERGTSETSKPAVSENQENLKQDGISDFGEKLEGAKKDLWQTYRNAMSDELPSDLKEITLSKHFPEPDYEGLIANGTDIRAIAAIKGMRDEIPTKPHKSYKLQRWAEQLKTLRAFSNDILNGSIAVDKVMSEMRKVHALQGIADRIELYTELGYPALKSAKGYEVSGGWTRPGVQGEQFGLRTPEHRVSFFNTRQEVIEALRAKLATAPETKEGGRSTKLDIYRVTATGDIVIGKKLTSNKYVDLKAGFSSAREAREYLSQHEKDLLELLEKKKETPPERRSTNNPRIGKDHRLGEDVTPEKFAAEFGFRGVQFGNYVEQSKRGKDLNNAYDALLDMASTLGIPPRAVSLNGSLGLAFGARGSGGKGAAAAHYAHGNVVINLTKNNGSGRLGHEWFHALDNYFAKMRGEEYLTHKPVQKMVRSTDTTLVADESVRPEVLQAFEHVMKAIKSSEFYRSSQRLDGRRTKDYWSTNEELAARAFESYLIAKAQERGEANDYLANVVDEDVWKAAEGLGFEDENTYPYPTRADQEKLNPLFDTLFQTLQAKETDKGIALASHGESGAGQTIESITKATAALRNNWHGFRNIKIVQSVKEVPNNIYLRALRALKPIDQGSEGVYDPSTNTVYLIADNISTPERAAWVAIHEVVGHGGIRMLGSPVVETLDHAAKNPFVSKLSQAIAKDREETFDSRVHTDEAIAELAAATVTGDADALLDRYGVNVPVGMRSNLMGMINRVVDAVRNFMARALGRPSEKVSDGEVLGMIHRMKGAVEGFDTSQTFDEAMKESEQYDTHQKREPRNAYEHALQYAEIPLHSGTRGKMSPEGFARMALDELTAENDALFNYKKSSSKSLEGVMRDVVKGSEYLGDMTRADERAESEADHRYAFKTADGKLFYVYEKDNGEVWIDVSRLAQGSSGGGAIYAAMGNYAYNTGKRFIGDPFGLSPEAVVRRTHHMLSSAIRFGTTRHLDAAKQQTWGMPEDGVEPLNWRGSDIDKVEAMIHTIVKTADNLAPSLKDYHYDFQNYQFSDAQGRPVTGAAMAANTPRDAGIGEKTARRVVLLRSLLDSSSTSESGGRNGVLEQILQWTDTSVPKDLERLFSRSPKNDVHRGDRGSSTSEASKDALIPEETTTQKVQRIAQDKMNRFSVIRDWLESQGTKLSEAADVWMHEGNMYGKVAARSEDFRTKTVEPLIERTQKAGFTMGQVAEYLEMQHIPEANAQMREIHQNPDATANGVTDAEAKAVLSQYQAMPNFDKLKAIADDFRGITDSTRKILLDAGIITPEMAEAWKQTYQNYVPLKGDEKQTGTGKGLNVNGKTKRRLGHGDREEAVIQNILRDHERAINLAEKNKVGIALVRMAVEAQNDDLITVNKPEKRQVMKPGQSSYVVTYAGADLMAFNNLKDAQTYVAFNGKGKDFSIRKTTEPDAVTLMAAPMLGDHEVNVYINGHTVRVQLNDELLARAYTNMGVEHVGMLLAGAREFNSWLSKAYTGYNPEFALVNMFRDLFAGTINLTGDYGVGMTAKIYSNYPKAFKELVKSFSDPAKSQIVTDYRKAGGNTGAAYLSDIERIGKDVMDSYNEYAGAIDTYQRVRDEAKESGHGATISTLKATGKAVAAKYRHIPLVGHFLRLMEHVNAVTENALRVATYMTLKENGHSDAKAAQAAKLSTVNFNRKGELANTSGALWLFFNPNVQGTQRLMQVLGTAEHKNQARALVGMMALGAFALAEMMRGNDDDKWKKIPGYVKDRNIVFMFGDTEFTIPMPYGYGIFHTLGNVMSDVMHGENAWKAGIRLADSMFNNFSPIGDPIKANGDSADFKPLQLLPTTIKMAIAPSVNENGMGSPIQPTQYEATKPDSQNMYRTTKGTVYADVAEGMNSLTGGNSYRKGMVDVSPETLKFWVDSLTGGAGKFVIDSINLAKVEVQGVDAEIREFPIVRKFVREASIADARQRYWDLASDAKQAAAEFHAAAKIGDRAGIDEMLKDERPLLMMAKYADGYDKLIKSKRDLVDAIRTNENLPLPEKRRQMKEVEAQEMAVYDQFIRTFEENTKQMKH